MYRKIGITVSLLFVVLFASCSNDMSENYSTVDFSSVLSSFSVSAPNSSDTSIIQSKIGSVLILETNTYKEYQLMVELSNIRGGSYGAFSGTDGRYQYIVKIPKELEIVYPQIVDAGPRPIDDPNKTADIWPCIQLKEDDKFSDFFENFDSDNFGAIQVDKGSYQGESGNTIYYDVLEYYEGGFAYAYNFLVVVEEDVAAGFTFYSRNPERTETEQYYRSIVETVRKA